MTLLCCYCVDHPQKIEDSSKIMAVGQFYAIDSAVDMYFGIFRFSKLLRRLIEMESGNKVRYPQEDSIVANWGFSSALPAYFLCANINQRYLSIVHS